MKEQKIIRVAGYIRISTDEEHQPYSLSAQEDRIKEYIRFRRKEGYRLFRIYSDQKSGATLDRPGLQSLMSDAEKGLFDLVLIVKMDRLWRDLTDQLHIIDQFQKLGIKLEGTDEDIDLETPDGITWAQIRGAFNEAERRKISYRTKIGMRKKASLGGWCGGYTPFGYRYDKNTKTLIPDPYEAPIVKEMFHLYVEKKMGAKSIALYLNRKGIRTRNGCPFSPSRVIAIITNSVYAGNIRWNGEIFDGKHQSLVDKETFKKAQSILSERRGDPSLRRSNLSDYPLSGLLQCQLCGRHLVGVSAHGRNRTYQYYACPGKFKYGECRLENLPRKKVDNIVFSQIKKIFANETLVKNILKRTNIKRAEKIPKKEVELHTVKVQISKKQSIIQRYLSAFESGTLDAVSCNERVKKIESEIMLLQERKTQLEQEIKESKIQPLTLQEIKKVIGKLDEIILSASPSLKKAFLRKIIKIIKVHPSSHLEPYYKIPLVCIMSGVAPRAGLEPAT